MRHLNIREIQEILPHRHPFLLLDYIEDYEPGQYAIGYKCVSYREEYFAGHFPGEPVMPGVLTIEALAQTGAVAILSLPGDGDCICGGVLRGGSGCAAYEAGG